MFAQLCQQITVIKRFSSLNPAIPVYENQKENSRNDNTSTMTMSMMFTVHVYVYVCFSKQARLASVLALKWSFNSVCYHKLNHCHFK